MFLIGLEEQVHEAKKPSAGHGVLGFGGLGFRALGLGFREGGVFSASGVAFSLDLWAWGLRVKGGCAWI